MNAASQSKTFRSFAAGNQVRKEVRRSLLAWGEREGKAVDKYNKSASELLGLNPILAQLMWIVPSNGGV
jgi:hypothetical protein